MIPFVFRVRCTNPECYLFRGSVYRNYPDAALVRAAHVANEARWKTDEVHCVVIEQVANTDPTVVP